MQKVGSELIAFGVGMPLTVGILCGFDRIINETPFSRENAKKQLPEAFTAYLAVFPYRNRMSWKSPVMSFGLVSAFLVSRDLYNKKEIDQSKILSESLKYTAISFVVCYGSLAFKLLRR